MYNFARINSNNGGVAFSWSATAKRFLLKVLNILLGNEKKVKILKVSGFVYCGV